MPNETTRCGITDIDLPPGFSWLGFGRNQFVLVNHNSRDHRSQWTNNKAMKEAAWDWWHDVRENRRG